MAASVSVFPHKSLSHFIGKMAHLVLSAIRYPRISLTGYLSLFKNQEISSVGATEHQRKEIFVNVLAKGIKQVISR
jgi:hypothetical protein